MLGRLPMLAEVANPATFMASVRDGLMTGVIADVTRGYVVDQRRWGTARPTISAAR